MRGAAYLHYPLHCLHSPFLLTRLMRGAAGVNKMCRRILRISTHAPHARRGPLLCISSGFLHHFYSRASCEARRGHDRHRRSHGRFLLTRLMRGAAEPVMSMINEYNDFYSRASCEARRFYRRI